MLGNVHPRRRSKVSNIQLLLLAKSTTVAEFGINRMLEPIVKDIQKLESVSEFLYVVHVQMCANTMQAPHTPTL